MNSLSYWMVEWFKFSHPTASHISMSRSAQCKCFYQQIYSISLERMTAVVPRKIHLYSNVSSFSPFSCVLFHSQLIIAIALFIVALEKIDRFLLLVHIAILSLVKNSFISKLNLNDLKVPKQHLASDIFKCFSFISLHKPNRVDVRSDNTEKLLCVRHVVHYSGFTVEWHWWIVIAFSGMSEKRQTKFACAWNFHLK